jgi:thioredoxin-related protein
VRDCQGSRILHQRIDGSDTIELLLAYLNGNQAIMKIVVKQSLAILFLVAAFNCWSTVHADGLPVVKDFTVEAREAHQRQLPILVLFMSETCEYCETVLQEFLLPMQRNPEFKDKVILRQIESSSKDALIDFDGKPTTYSSFSSRHKVGGVPNVMLFDSNGQVLTFIEGLLTVDFYYSFLVDAIDESLAKVKAAGH